MGARKRDGKRSRAFATCAVASVLRISLCGDGSGASSLAATRPLRLRQRDDRRSWERSRLVAIRIHVGNELSTLLVLRRLLIETQKRLLCQLLGPIALARHVGQVVDDRVIMALDQISERVSISRLDANHENRIGVLSNEKLTRSREHLGSAQG